MLNSLALTINHVLVVGFRHLLIEHEFGYSIQSECSVTDTITDFTPGQDRVALSTTTFGVLEGQWFARAGAATPATRVIQEGATLYLDADGSGGSYEPVAFATLPEGVQLGPADIVVVP